MFLSKRLRKETEARLEHNKLEVGHRVMFVAGPFEGLTGIISATHSSTLEIAISCLDTSAEVLPYEVWKEIRPGDKVVVTGGCHAGTRGWVVGVSDNPASIFVRGDSGPIPDTEANIVVADIMFDDHHQNDNLRNLTSNESRLTCWALEEEKKEMRRNPNSVFIGKEVMVTGAHAYKGVTGIIKDTSLDGQAQVALNLFNHPKHKSIPLDLLRLVYTDPSNLKTTRVVLQPLIWDQHSKTAVVYQHPEPTPVHPSTPAHTPIGHL
ncbi:hypothetical protein CPC08DRAFT_771100 [Agrocybe pediades]|nr:hypothetical protein CPC08DRAFT_771100 [Agrocybe pediades]